MHTVTAYHWTSYTASLHCVSSYSPVSCVQYQHAFSHFTMLAFNMLLNHCQHGTLGWQISVVTGKWSDSNSESVCYRSTDRDSTWQLLKCQHHTRSLNWAFKASFNTSGPSLSTLEHKAQQPVRRRQGGEDWWSSHPVTGNVSLRQPLHGLHSFNMKDTMTDVLFLCRRTAVTCTGCILQYVYIVNAHATWAQACCVMCSCNLFFIQSMRIIFISPLAKASIDQNTKQPLLRWFYKNDDIIYGKTCLINTVIIMLESLG